MPHAARLLRTPPPASGATAPVPEPRSLLLVVLLGLVLLLVAARLLIAHVAVHGLADLHLRLLKRVHRGLELLRLDVVLGRGLLEGADVAADRVDVLLSELVLVLHQVLLGLVDGGVRAVLQLDPLLARRVVGRVPLCVLQHLLDVLVREAAAAADLDALLLARALVARAHVDDAVCVDVEGDLDLRHAARAGRDVGQVELAEHLVVARHLPLALQHLDPHLRLVVRGRGEGLRLLRRDGGVARDELGHHAAKRLDAERERRYVEQQDVLHVATQHAALDRRADRDDLVGVDALVRLAPEEFADHLLHLWHARHAADEDHLVDVLGRDAGVLEAVPARRDGAIDQIVGEGLELGARHLHVEVLRAGLVRRDEGEVDVGLCGGRELALRFLARLAQPLQRQAVLGQVEPMLLLERVAQEPGQHVVEVLAAQVRVAVGRLHLEDAAGDLEHGHVKGAAAQVVDCNHLVVALLHAVRERGRRRLVDDAQHVQPGDLARVLSGLALRVVEVGGHRHYRLRDGATEEGLCRLLHLDEREGANLRRRVVFARRVHPRVAVGRLDNLVRHHREVLLHDGVIVPAAEQSFRGEERVRRVCDRLPLGRHANKPLPVICERDHRRSGARALGVLDHLGEPPLHYRHARVGRAQVNADHVTHPRAERARRLLGQAHRARGRPKASQARREHPDVSA
mmetsp:Transcript_25082/g.63666  ORF Transcript_25082/g.63666 Transcript_25082/m.63666 type:complete len:685 (+) Transcript_25082:209-2263(+)